MLLNILWKYGVRGPSHKILQSYLVNRKQLVEITHTDVNGKSVKMRSQQSETLGYSVPQGSVLGPYFFILYTNALAEYIKELGGYPIIYVDDTTIITTANNWTDLNDKIVHVLSNVKQFFLSLNLMLNWDKTVIIRFGKEIYVVKDTKFLGTYVQESLKWQIHMNHCTVN